MPQIELYCGIGQVISGRSEKGAAVAAAEYLQSTYPDTPGFSPRNLRRMRDFYRAYKNTPDIMTEAVKAGWTQNVVILEANLTLQERARYISAVQQFSWSKAELLRKIAARAHLELPLDLPDTMCYTDGNENSTEESRHDEDSVCVLGQYLPQSDGGVCDEGPGGEGRPGRPVPYRVSRDILCGRAGLSSCVKEAGRARDRLRGKILPPAQKVRLRQVRPHHWNGQSQPCNDAAHFRWRPVGQAPPAAGLHRPPRKYRGPVVHRRL